MPDVDEENCEENKEGKRDKYADLSNASPG